ncbi:Zn-ribbon domain-containing OB-fold protein [Streptomyces sp. NPDC051018]|uniref:Zn-ribbon domain-containing OB-fold protein n=1 Tax=Streptomyces sp. NPDC051018 TaxID=3365639 RepID=UPI0037A76192
MTAPVTEPEGVRVPPGHVDTDGTRLIGGHCDACDVTACPPPAQCPGCLGELRPMPLSPTGNLYSYSVIHIGPADRAVPYTVGYVDLPESARVFAHITETDESALRPDTPVRLRLTGHEDGHLASWVPVAGAAKGADHA